MGSAFFGQLPSNLDVVGVIMAGGHGTRFWPQSRRSYPKQFLNLVGDDESLIQATAKRLEPLASAEGILVVTAEDQRELVAEHLPQVAVLAEPMPRNTAPCIGFAATKVLESVGDVPMICSPADHFIQQPERFADVLRSAAELARAEDILITIGITPDKPETGYGYIKAGDTPIGSVARNVERFVEKPDEATAKTYLADGGYYWNSGIFVWRPSVILKAIELCLPELSSNLCAVGEAFGGGDELEKLRGIFEAIDPVSIDVGVMEKANNVAMIPGEGFAWSDVGSWSAWAECLVEGGRSDKHGNLARGDVMLLDSSDCVVVAKDKLVATVGMQDVIVVDAGDAVLVCPRDRAQDVKKIVDELAATGRKDLL